MKLSARNQLKGTIVDVVKGATTSHVRIDIGGGVIVTSSITNEAWSISPCRKATRFGRLSRPPT
jgi:molybdopterin-binding protein